MSEKAPGTRKDDDGSEEQRKAPPSGSEDKYLPEESHGSHAGRPGSWVAVAIMITGFVVGGVALTIGPSWVMFWIGVAIIVVGCIVGGVVKIFSDVVVDAPRVIPEIVDYSVFGSRSAKRRGGRAGETLDKPVHTDTQHTPHG
ncbi:hypothetical protein Acsp03_13270 [Actinomadura sp. NBRC 104412]|uniref:HGxxPAAW family protein n=1 Tax=Actinomadura sp. NBRC 104412 TaxID=3032203 RepID=UPI0024A0E61F|nr:HGxxPAAW family protein [Actinomadura sp. NBRC 104412]GLZ03861.1 hypothetical protein Acsp03_13270 [Actinomadura sp. NBRC 104412]